MAMSALPVPNQTSLLLRRGRLVGPLLATVVATAIGVVAAIVWWIGAREWQRTMTQWQARLSSVAAQREQLIDAWLRERRGDSEVVAGYPSLVELLDDTGRSESERREKVGHLSVVLDGLAQAYGYMRVTVHDRDGRVVVRTGDSVVPTADVIRQRARRAGHRELPS